VYLKTKTIAFLSDCEILNFTLYYLYAEAFVVPPEARKIVIASAAQKWREFKSRLTTLYIIPHKDEPDLLEFPPEDYKFIEKTH
jgi:hypothetical protein